MTNQPFAGQQQIFITNQQQLPSNQHPQLYIHNQPLTFLPYNYQHQMIHSGQRQQLVQCNLLPPSPPPYNIQQSDAHETSTSG